MQNYLNQIKIGQWDRTPQLQVVLPDGNKWCKKKSEERYSREQILDYWNQGCSFILTISEFLNGNMWRQCQHFEKVYGIGQANIYCSKRKDAHCFPIHADSTDNFLFHVSGKIRWYIYKEFSKDLGHDRLKEILQGIKNLQDLGFENIKINAVLLNGINSSEKDFDKWSDFIKNNKINFRYIELMQTGDNLEYFKKYHASSKIFKNYLNKNNWIYQTLGRDAGPSLNYINPEYKGKLGIIAPYSKDFCKTCNRLRITSRGDLRLCLFGSTGINVRHLLQKDDQLNELKDLILKQMQFKKESHYLELGETGLTKNLSKTGG